MVRIRLQLVFLSLILFFLTLSSPCFAWNFEWEDLRKPFKTKVGGITSNRKAHIEFTLPKFNNKKSQVQLIVKVKNEAANFSTDVYFTVNEQTEKNAFNFIIGKGEKKTIRVNINSKLLKEGKNILHFGSKSHAAYGSYTITELRFDLPDSVMAQYSSDHAVSASSKSKLKTTPTAFQWNDFTRPFTDTMEFPYSGIKITVKVEMPESILKQYSEFPLEVKHSGIEQAFRQGVLNINKTSIWEEYKIVGPEEKPYTVMIKTKDLKPGLNNFTFSQQRKLVSTASARERWYIYELRFDLPDSVMAQYSDHAVSASSKSKIKTTPTAQKDITPPQIIISSHDATRGVKVVEKKKKTTITGTVTDSSGIVDIVVNGKEATFDSSGNFETEIYLGKGRNKITVSAMDQYENWGFKTFTIFRQDLSTPKQTAKQIASSGNNYALIIGNNNYKYIPKLETAKGDAEAVSRLLHSLYGFQTELLLDASRNDIVRAINKFRKKLTLSDQLLIYYAGHGEFNKDTGKAYWLPVDARSDEDTNWILADRITSNIKINPSKHILIVSDSCYSGTFTRRTITDLSTTKKRSRYLQRMQSKKSRTLLSSGGNEPVSDIGGGGHSVFAKAFLSGLMEMDRRQFTAEELYYQHIKEMVAGNSEQTPEYNIIRNSGHEGGDFIFNRVD